jgi:hypothetical protein
MTRQFNQQPQDDSRLLSHNTSSNRSQGKQSSHPARPRLNRAMVDRGWENGTPRYHPDYRPQSGNGQAPHNNGRNNQERRSSSYNGPAGGRTDGNRQPNYRKQAQRSEPASQSYPVSRKQPLNFRGDNVENRQFSNQQGDELYSYNNRQGQNNRRQPQGRDFNFRTQGYSQGRSSDSSYNRRQPNREHVNGSSSNRSQHGSVHNKGRGYERPINGNQEQRELHPRLQSRPEAFQRQQGGRRSQEGQRYAPHRQQFEGDYEQFGYDTPAQAESSARKSFRDNQHDRSGRRSMPYQNSHTRKGPRLVSRKDDEFRASIKEDAEELISQVHSSPLKPSPVHEETASLPETTTDNDGSEDQPLAFSNEQAKPSATKETKQAINAKNPKKDEIVQPLSKGRRPFQRGYKWPTP